MESKYLTILCVLLISAALTEGFAYPHQGQRCLCEKTVKKLKLKKVSQIELFPKSATCSNIEVLATMKSGKKKSIICIDPNIKLVKEIIAGKKKNVKVINHLSKQG
ncbi:C-X-C motif chemokine 10 precursor [Pelobates cultripes]|uniref:C-X-C motif chemokine 10 n=1 Tax=Pelobates cultripes TaxID=61616 RepID=A0AAD1WEN0_PELCU|nr:C-X-C motif chemokine 10 precursor [Pelobates cultripes]